MDKPDIKYKSKVNPLIADLPNHLKDPANFEDIQLKIFKSVATSCSHADLFEMAECQKCTDMMVKRRKLMKELGFKNARQYMAWRQTHQEIKKRYPLINWKTRQPIKI